MICNPEVTYWSNLGVYKEGKAFEVLAVYTPGDEDKIETGKTYKELILILEKYLKSYYCRIVPKGEEVTTGLKIKNTGGE